ncbi:restriction endonuclease [Vibrio sp. SALL6]|uniref:restriction endonuclease n=1 Tax=Vibrio sp. SALL6 TaxID=1904359 RepID=UPI000984C8CD|nr:restriction endonuclease [Vibrio sp. SALL6]OOI00032.1 hypothetical protein BIW15_22285 [Vibrio sp. SALL6]
MYLELKSWQKSFVENYSNSSDFLSTLVAQTGSGKTVTSLLAAKEHLQRRDFESVIILTDRIELMLQWRQVAQDLNLSVGEFGDYFNSVQLSTYQKLSRYQNYHQIIGLSKSKKVLFIFDESHSYHKWALALSEQIKLTSPNSRILFISSTPVLGTKTGVIHEMKMDTERLNSFELYDLNSIQRIETEIIVDPLTIVLPSVQESIITFSPSSKLLYDVLSGKKTIEGMSWQQFENFVARLLEADGYEVEQTQGSKDGGVDVIAHKNLGISGTYRTVWQAKKYKESNKIGIDLVRELADVRNEFGASKGMIITSSYLTAGALKRIERDRYTLGKVDRTDLDEWIEKILRDNG